MTGFLPNILLKLEDKITGKKHKNPFDNPDFMYEAFDRVRYAQEIAKKERCADQVPEENLLDFQNCNGFFIGMPSTPYSSKYVGKSHGADGSFLIDGTPGSGKTSAIVIPTMATWTDRQIIFDIKGTLRPHTALDYAVPDDFFFAAFVRSADMIAYDCGVKFLSVLVPVLFTHFLGNGLDGGTIIMFRADSSVSYPTLTCKN